MRDLSGDLDAIAERLSAAARYLAIEEKRSRMRELEEEMAKPDLWDDPKHGAQVGAEYGRLNEDVKLLDAITGRLTDARTLHELAVEEGDDSVAGDLEAMLESLLQELDELELRSLFTGEFDEGDAVCEVHAGEGGTDAQDWTEMMLRMYTRWAERRGFEFEIDEVTEGQEAGLLSTTFIVRGRYAYGLVSAERGVHRLYRISPFDSQAR